MATRRPCPLEFSDRAHDQIEAIRAYIRGRNPPGALKVIDTIEVACRRFGARPYMGRPGRSANTREWSVTKYRYVIVYEVSQKPRKVTVLGVFHTSLGERKL